MPESIGDQLVEYCKRYNIPLDYIFEILGDQKVVPMIRGKAMEYNAYLILRSTLARSEWDVQKLNLNAQPGIYDEDISITHRRTGIILKVESKSAVRGSFSIGLRSRVYKNIPHFKVKCHRSRSNISLAGTSNDRYSVESFDILISNPTNSLFEGNTIGEDFELVQIGREYLNEYYSVESDEDLISATESDWRFVLPTDISEDGYIPRTPYVKMEDDLFWKSLDQLEPSLLRVVDMKKRKRPSSRRK